MSSYKVVQSDTNFCSPARGYHWGSVRIIGVWAHEHGHAHVIYCLQDCAHQQLGRRHPSWCKLVAIAHALSADKTTRAALYLDSDALWNMPEQPIAKLVENFTRPQDWHQGAMLWFGCNGNYTRGWKFNVSNAQNGAPNAGAILARNHDRTLALLRAWWGRPHGHTERFMSFWGSAAEKHYSRRYKSYAFSGNWEQSILWVMWACSRHAAAAMRVLTDVNTHECMWSVPGRPSPITHLCAPGTTRERRVRARNWRLNLGSLHARRECTARNLDPYTPQLKVLVMKRALHFLVASASLKLSICFDGPTC